MTEDMNPYSAPLDTPVAGTGKPSAAAFIDGTLEFDGEVTQFDHQQAVRQAGIRTDYGRALRASLFIVVPIMILVVMRLMGPNQQPAQQFSTLSSALVIGVAAVTFTLYQRWFIGTLVPSLQCVSGPIRGRLDGEGLWLESVDQSHFFPWHALVSTAVGRDVWALSFNRQQLQWATIPWSCFADQNAAKTVAADLHRLYPPLKPMPHDSRRWDPPKDPAKRERAEGDVAFDGPFFVEWLEGTSSSRWSRRLSRNMQWLTFGFVGLVALGVLLLTGWDPLALLAGMIWIGLIIGFVWLRLWFMQRKGKRDGKTILFHSRGWFDREGYFAMTQISQGFLSWQTFKEYEINDQIIALYPNLQQHYAFCAARDQFASEADWEQACDYVRSGMETA